MKRVFPILVVTLIFTATAYAEVHIPDPHLRSAVHDYLDLPDKAPSTRDAMLLITQFS